MCLGADQRELRSVSRFLARRRTERRLSSPGGGAYHLVFAAQIFHICAPIFRSVLLPGARESPGRSAASLATLVPVVVARVGVMAFSLPAWPRTKGARSRARRRKVSGGLTFLLAYMWLTVDAGGAVGAVPSAAALPPAAVTRRCEQGECT